MFFFIRFIVSLKNLDEKKVLVPFTDRTKSLLHKNDTLLFAWGRHPIEVRRETDTRYSIYSNLGSRLCEYEGILTKCKRYWTETSTFHIQKIAAEDSSASSSSSTDEDDGPKIYKIVRHKFNFFRHHSYCLDKDLKFSYCENKKKMWFLLEDYRQRPQFTKRFAIKSKSKSKPNKKENDIIANFQRDAGKKPTSSLEKYLESEMNPALCNFKDSVRLGPYHNYSNDSRNLPSPLYSDDIQYPELPEDLQFCKNSCDNFYFYNPKNGDFKDIGYNYYPSIDDLSPREKIAMHPWQIALYDRLRNNKKDEFISCNEIGDAYRKFLSRSFEDGGQCYRDMLYLGITPRDIEMVYPSNYGLLKSEVKFPSFLNSSAGKKYSFADKDFLNNCYPSSDNHFRQKLREYAHYVHQNKEEILQDIARSIVDEAERERTLANRLSGLDGFTCYY